MATVIHVAAEVEQARYLFSELKRWVAVLKLETNDSNIPGVVFLKRRELEEVYRLMNALIADFPEAFAQPARPASDVDRDVS
jgi:hypothetical protein